MRPPYPLFLGGAARCAHQIMRRISVLKNVECMAVGSSDFNSNAWFYPDKDSYRSLDIETVDTQGRQSVIDCGYTVRLIPDYEKELGSIIDEYRPDVIWTQLEGAEDIAKLAKRKNIPVLHFIHDAEFDVDELISIENSGAEFVCSSRFLARKSGDILVSDRKVVYPCPKLDFGVKGDPDGYIAMINPHRVKGVDTFYEIARLLPKEKFLLLESWKLDKEDIQNIEQRLEELPNVSFQRRVSDMAEIYSKTRLLLVPSVWEEGFGMVAVEAQSCSIPVIASNRGGLPEAVGNGGILIDDYKNPKCWVDAINTILNYKETYAEWSVKAKMNAAKECFSSDASAKKYLQIAEEIASKKTHGKIIGKRVRRIVKRLKNMVG